MIIDDAPVARSSEPDLIPLINIVFLLLVFFMLSGSLAPQDTVQAARVNSARPLDADLLIISVDQGGRTIIDSRYVDEELVRQRLSEQLAAGGRAGIRPDARLEAQRLVELTGLFKAAGFEQMTLITQASFER